MTDNQTTICPTCHGDGKILAMWNRGPGDPPGNGVVGCPDCSAGRIHDAAVQAETDAALEKFRSNCPVWVQSP